MDVSGPCKPNKAAHKLTLSRLVQRRDTNPECSRPAASHYSFANFGYCELDRDLTAILLDLSSSSQCLLLSLAKAGKQLVPLVLYGSWEICIFSGTVLLASKTGSAAASKIRSKRLACAFSRSSGTSPTEADYAPPQSCTLNALCRKSSLASLPERSTRVP